jgi:hypothetical protein
MAVTMKNGVFWDVALRSSETSVFTRATRRNTPEDCILHSHRRENLKSYTTYFKLTIEETKEKWNSLPGVLDARQRL